MRIESTSDISLGILTNLNDALPVDLRGEVDHRQRFFKSLEPPSWVAFVADAAWWVKALAAIATVVVTAIASEAGKDAWRSRKRLSQIVAKVPQVLNTPVIDLIVRLRSKLERRTRIEVELPIPNGHYGMRLQLEGDKPEDIATDLVFFHYHLPGLLKLVESGTFDSVTGQVSLKLLVDGDLEVSWLDNAKLQFESRQLKLPSAE